MCKIIFGLLLLLIMAVLYVYLVSTSRISGEIHWKSLTDEQLDTITQDWDGCYYTLDGRKVICQEGEKQDMIDYIIKKRCLL